MHILASVVKTVQTNVTHVCRLLLHPGLSQPQEDASRHALLKLIQNSQLENARHVLATATGAFHRMFVRLASLDSTTTLLQAQNYIHKASPNAWMRVQLLRSHMILPILLPVRNVQVLAIHVKEQLRHALLVRMATVSSGVNVSRIALLITNSVKTMFAIGLVRESCPSSL